MTTLVSVGNAHQPFTRLVDAVISVAGQLPQPVIVQHGHTPCRSHHIKAIPFMNMDEFERIVMSASVLIVHAGCGVLINAFHSGHTPVVMPRRKKYDEHIDDHQMEITAVMAAQDRIIRADTAEQLIGAVKAAMNRKRAAQHHFGSSKAVAHVRRILSRYADRIKSR